MKFEIDQLAEEHVKDDEYSGDLRPESANSVADYLKFLIDEDRKSTPLKAIQGLIWRSGYEKGEIVSPVFEDVPAALKKWRSEDKTIAIFSSGSILAQQLLFRYTDQGDLTPFISNYFDTNTGPKRETKSYGDIADALEVKTADVLYISDIQAELDSARSAGMQTSMAVRPGNAQIDGDCTHGMIESFISVD